MADLLPEWLVMPVIAVGLLNWLVYGLGILLTGTPINLVEMLLGTGNLAAVVYIVVGIAGLPWYRRLWMRLMSLL